MVWKVEGASEVGIRSGEEGVGGLILLSKSCDGKWIVIHWKVGLDGNRKV